MNKLVAVIKKLAIEMILNDDIKVKMIASLNKKINIPLISEKTEAELINEIEKLRSTGSSNDADRADILRRQLENEYQEFEHLSTFYSQAGEK